MLPPKESTARATGGQKASDLLLPARSVGEVVSIGEIELERERRQEA
jgi:hypothetical protein